MSSCWTAVPGVRHCVGSQHGHPHLCIRASQDDSPATAATALPIPLLLPGGCHHPPQHMVPTWSSPAGGLLPLADPAGRSTAAAATPAAAATARSRPAAAEAARCLGPRSGSRQGEQGPPGGSSNGWRASRRCHAVHAIPPAVAAAGAPADVQCLDLCTDRGCPHTPAEGALDCGQLPLVSKSDTAVASATGELLGFGLFL